MGKRRITGVVQATSATEVTVALASGTEKYPVNQIESIVYDQEPTYLTKGRGEYVAGRYEESLAMLAKVEMGAVKRTEVRQDLEFYKAASAARLAQAGAGEIAKAGTKLASFVGEFPESYHALEAGQLVGDFLMTVGQFAKAREYYERVGAKVAVARVSPARGARGGTKLSVGEEAGRGFEVL